MLNIRFWVLGGWACPLVKGGQATRRDGWPVDASAEPPFIHSSDPPSDLTIAPPPATEPISLIFWPHISPRTSSRPSPGKSSLAIDFFECIYQTSKYMRDWVGLLTWVDLAASPTMRLISNLHRALLVFVQPIICWPYYTSSCHHWTRDTRPLPRKSSLVIDLWHDQTWFIDYNWSLTWQDLVYQLQLIFDMATLGSCFSDNASLKPLKSPLSSIFDPSRFLARAVKAFEILWNSLPYQRWSDFV